MFLRKMGTRNLITPTNGGFTLIELICTLAIIVLLASVALPALAKYIRQIKITEAPLLLKNIYDMEVAHFNQLASDATRFSWEPCKDDVVNGPLCHAFTLTHIGDGAAGIPPRGIKKVLDFHYPKVDGSIDRNATDWRKSFPHLGLKFDTPSSFAFSVYPGAASVAGKCFRPEDYYHFSFTASAYGDLDGNGIFSTFSRLGYVNLNREVQGGERLYTYQPLE
jgi:type IV pilus assembly protein PilA